MCGEAFGVPDPGSEKAREEALSIYIVVPT
jgi:hypothetical protein